ncbi:MAG: porin family protein [Flavobacteriales bacterium]
MFKFISRTALFVFITSTPFATTSAQSSGNTAGIKAGLNWSNLHVDGEDVGSENARIGFNAGIFGRLSPTEQLGIQAELLYTTKGTKVTYDGLIDQEVTFNLAYLELPVFAAIRLGDVIELHGGVYAGYLLSSSVSSDGDLGSSSDDLDRDNFQGADYGVLGGVAVNFGPAQIGARYNYGLTNLANSDAAKAFLGDARNACAQIYLAIGLGGKD